MDQVDLGEPLEGVIYKKDAHVARITLNRPDRGNAFTPGMRPIFRAIWEDVREDDEIRCAILTGNGKHFCTGGDADAGVMGAMTGDGPLTEEIFWSPKENRVWKPVICAVNGLCLGAAFHFVNDSDIIVASETAQFGDNHVNLGLVGGIENVGLARRLPLGAVLRMTFEGKHYRLTAERAYQLGLVDEISPPEKLLEVAEQIARHIVEGSPHAISYSQQAVWKSMEVGYLMALEYSWALVRAHWNHPDSTEGPRALLEKREPVWITDARWRR